MTTAIFFVCVCSATAIGVVAGEVVNMRRRRRLRKYLRQITRLIQLTRDTIDLAYIYNDNPEKFYSKFLEQINVSSLRERGIIDSDILLHSRLHKFIYKKLPNRDAELWVLRKTGFTARELTIIYNLNNINSIYVKLYRLNKRFDKIVALIKNTSNKYSQWIYSFIYSL